MYSDQKRPRRQSSSKCEILERSPTKTRFVDLQIGPFSQDGWRWWRWWWRWWRWWWWCVKANSGKLEVWVIWAGHTASFAICAKFLWTLFLHISLIFTFELHIFIFYCHFLIASILPMHFSKICIILVWFLPIFVPKIFVSNLSVCNFTQNIDSRSFVAREFLLQIFTLLSVKFPGLKKC